MKVSIVALLAALAVALPVGDILAAETYYIELGDKAANAADANAGWDALAANYPTLLKSLQHYPKPVIRHHIRTGVDILAGPLASRPKAEKICKKLFADNVPCFIVEGLTAPPEYSDEPEPAVLPWLVAPAPQQDVIATPVAPSEAPARMPRRGLLSWLNEEDKPAAPPPVSIQAPAPQQPSSEAKVEVAEAIHVPLTEPENVVNQPVSITPLPETGRKPIKATVSDGHGWLNIYRFADNVEAESFWQQVRERFPQKSSALRVRVIRPVLAAQDSAPASLSIGPFPAHANADAFCRDYIVSLNSALECRYELGEPPAVNALRAARPAAGAHGDAYAERRRTMMLQRNMDDSGEKPAGWTRTMAPAGNSYWAQVFSADTEMEALQGLEDIRTANSDLLEGVRSSVSASLTAHHKSYVVRIGPIAKNEDAIALCKSLSERGVTCRIMMAGGM